MVAVPALTPETIPDEEPTVAVPVAPLVHEPPEGVAVKVVVVDGQTSKDPLIDGMALTVIGNVTKQPELFV
jgi:hypothetical protein